jgi:hypothetical protein
MLTGKTKEQFENWYTQSYYHVESHWERTKLRLMEGFYLFPYSHKFIIRSNFFLSIGISMKLSRKWSNGTFKYVCTVNGKVVEIEKEEDLLFEEKVQRHALEIACKINNNPNKQLTPETNNNPLTSLSVGQEYIFKQDFNSINSAQWEKGDSVLIEVWHFNLADEEGNEMMDVLEKCKKVV